MIDMVIITFAAAVCGILALVSAAGVGMALERNDENNFRAGGVNTIAFVLLTALWVTLAVME